MSSRRVKKGPGRRPLSAKRQNFMELRERGSSIRAAASEVGVSRSSGNNWASGAKVYRKGQVVGFVPPLDRLMVRRISARFLSQDERIEIADLRRAGLGVRQIAARLNRAPSTISRELRRNSSVGRGYRPFDAHRRATARRARHPLRRVEIEPILDGRWWRCWGNGGARNGSAGTCGSSSLRTPSCSCVTRASTRSSMRPAPRFCGPRSWHRIDAHRVGLDVITGALTKTRTVAGPGSSSRC
jgi:transposase